MINIEGLKRVIEMISNTKAKPGTKRRRPRGRPATLKGWVRRSVILEPRHVEIAEAMGVGNVSEGIRSALDMAGDAEKVG